VEHAALVTCATSCHADAGETPTTRALYSFDTHRWQTSFSCLLPALWQCIQCVDPGNGKSLALPPVFVQCEADHAVIPLLLNIAFTRDEDKGVHSLHDSYTEFR